MAIDDIQSNDKAVSRNSDVPDVASMLRPSNIEMAAGQTALRTAQGDTSGVIPAKIGEGQIDFGQSTARVEPTHGLSEQFAKAPTMATTGPQLAFDRPALTFKNAA